MQTSGFGIKIAPAAPKKANNPIPGEQIKLFSVPEVEILLKVTSDSASFHTWMNPLPPPTPKNPSASLEFLQQGLATHEISIKRCVCPNAWRGSAHSVPWSGQEIGKENTHVSQNFLPSIQDDFNVYF